MLLYSIGIGFYALGVHIATIANKKARLLVKGHNHIFDTLKEKVDKDAKYLWFHVSSDRKSVV